MRGWCGGGIHEENKGDGRMISKGEAERDREILHTCEKMHASQDIIHYTRSSTVGKTCESTGVRKA